MALDGREDESILLPKPEMRAWHPRLRKRVACRGAASRGEALGDSWGGVAGGGAGGKCEAAAGARVL